MSDFQKTLKQRIENRRATQDPWRNGALQMDLAYYWQTFDRAKIADSGTEYEARKLYLDLMLSMLQKRRYGLAAEYPETYQFAGQRFSSALQLMGTLEEELGTVPASVAMPSASYLRFLDDVLDRKIPKSPNDFRLYVEDLYNPPSTTVDVPDSSNMDIDQQIYSVFL